MPPIRRYLRITKYSVLECRIYLDNPVDGPRWLLNPRDPALPRIMQSVKPYVLPKLREERERTKERGKKVKSVKDVVVEDDFEVSVYLTETRVRHSLLTKSKTLKDKSSRRGQLNTSMGEIPATGNAASPVPIRDESEEENVNLDAIPLAEDSSISSVHNRSGHRTSAIEVDSDSSDDFEATDDTTALSNRNSYPDVEDDKKKLAMNTSYDGFSIYGRILCLVVTRKGNKTTNSGANQTGGQDMMKDWIMSTQAPKEVED